LREIERHDADTKDIHARQRGRAAMRHVRRRRAVLPPGCAGRIFDNRIAVADEAAVKSADQICYPSKYLGPTSTACDSGGTGSRLMKRR
jgi:hypothetical protein